MTPDPVLFLAGDVRACLRTLPAGSVHCVATSPPYWGLRAYGTAPQVWGGDPACPHAWADATVVNSRHADDSTAGGKQRSNAGSVDARGVRAGALCGCGAWRGELGQEPTPDLFVAHLVEVFRGVWRVLRDDGTCWVNLGDTYCTHPHGPLGANAADPKWAGARHRGLQGGQANRRALPGVKHKDRLLMPARVALALQADGWYLRDEIVWFKPNTMPSSVRDRTTAAHELVYLLAKRPRYYFDALAIAEPAITAGRVPRGTKAATPAADAAAGRPAGQGHTAATLQGAPVPATRNARSVWRIPTYSYRAAHFATWPPRLAERIVRAGTSERSVCPGCGSPWVRQIERVRRPTRPGERTKVKVPGGWDVTTGQGGHGSVHRAGRTAPTYRDAAEVGNRDPGRHVTEAVTVGWAPGCACPPADPVGAVVLDPFGGSGTTAAVALGLGRRAVLCELNPEYLELARARVRAAVGPLFLPEVPAAVRVDA